jgi:hypothetical protein
MEPGQIGDDLFFNAIGTVIKIYNKAQGITIAYKETYAELVRELVIANREIGFGRIPFDGKYVMGLKDGIRIEVGDSFVIVKNADVKNLLAKLSLWNLWDLSGLPTRIR